MRRKKLVVLLLFSFAVVNLFNPLIAEAKEEKTEPIVLSLEMAQEKALQNTISTTKANMQLRNLLKRNDYTYTDGEFNISDIQKTIDSLYTKLKSGSSMSAQQVAKLYILYTMYGDTAYFSGKEDITEYIMPNRYSRYSFWASVMKQSLQIQLTEISIKEQTRVLYDEILSVKSQLEILKMSVGLQEKLYTQQKSRYDLGELSKVSIEIEEKQLQTAKLELIKTTRTLDNLEMDFKKLVGVPISTTIVLSEYSKTNKEKFESYDTYLNSALINRNEIVIAKIDYWVGKNDLYIANNAFSDNPWNINIIMNKSLAQQRINEAELSLRDSEELVLQNINDGYIDVKCKKEEVDICKEKLDYANEQYKIATEKHKKQLISDTAKMSEKINSLSALSDYNEAVRNYNSALSRLQQASQLGLAY